MSSLIGAPQVARHEGASTFLDSVVVCSLTSASVVISFLMVQQLSVFSQCLGLRGSLCLVSPEPNHVNGSWLVRCQWGTITAVI